MFNLNNGSYLKKVGFEPFSGVTTHAEFIKNFIMIDGIKNYAQYKGYFQSIFSLCSEDKRGMCQLNVNPERKINIMQNIALL